jgi:small subunit ribosomal protein S20
MAHHKSAKKRIRQDAVRRLRNKAYRSEARSAVKTVRHALESNNLESAKTAYQQMVPVLDRMVSRSIIQKNTAARTKSRLNKQILSLTKSQE